MLSTCGLTASYGQYKALFGVDLHIVASECVAIIGANGAGKSTLMRSIAGVMKNAPEMVLFDERPIGALPSSAILKQGIALVPEGRRLFQSLDVEENILIGADARKGTGPWTLASIYDLFPALAEKRKLPSLALSGGQQQMVAIARALMSNPRVLLCDEISLGLAPVIIESIYGALPRIREEGTAILIVEQDVKRALRVADRAYCMMEGRVTLEGCPGELDDTAIHAAYFGEAV